MKKDIKNIDMEFLKNKIDEIVEKYKKENKDKYIGKEVYLRGWVRNIRFSKSIRVYRIK